MGYIFLNADVVDRTTLFRSFRISEDLNITTMPKSILVQVFQMPYKHQ